MAEQDESEEVATSEEEGASSEMNSKDYNTGMRRHEPNSGEARGQRREAEQRQSHTATAAKRYSHRRRHEEAALTKQRNRRRDAIKR